VTVSKLGNAQVGSPQTRNNGQSSWTIVIMAGTVVLTLIGQFWTLANPRDDLKQIKTDLKDADYHLLDELKTLRIDLNKEIEKNENELTEVRKLFRDSISDLLKATVTLREYEEFKSHEALNEAEEKSKILALETKAISSQEHADLKSRVDALQAHYVPREEHIEHWNQANERLKSITDSINDLRRDYSGTFTVTDVLKQLQKEIDEVRTQNQSIKATITQPITTVPLAPALSSPH
jgi:hypothetical protein